VRFKDVDIDKKNDDSVNRYAITTQGLKKKIIIIKFCDIVRVSINITSELTKHFSILMIIQ
jgi:hypothetical protein